MWKALKLHEMLTSRHQYLLQPIADLVNNLAIRVHSFRPQKRERLPRHALTVPSLSTYTENVGTDGTKGPTNVVSSVGAKSI